MRKQYPEYGGTRGILSESAGTTRRSFMAFLVERTDLEELEASPV